MRSFLETVVKNFRTVGPFQEVRIPSSQSVLGVDTINFTRLLTRQGPSHTLCGFEGRWFDCVDLTCNSGGGDPEERVKRCRGRGGGRGDGKTDPWNHVSVTCPTRPSRPF